MKTLLGQIAIENKLFIRAKDALFWTLLFPAFFIVLYGFIYGDQVWSSYNMRAIDYTLPGLIIMAILVTGIMATATGFIEDREKGIFRRFAVTPLKRQTIIAGSIIQRYIVILVQTVILILIGVLAFQAEISGNFFTFWLVLTVAALCFLSIGFALTTAVKSARAATPVCMIAFFILLFLGGIFFPLEIMPEFLQYICKVLPSTHINDAMRMIIIEGEGLGAVWQELLIVLGWTAACLIISVKFFKWE
jgi:ABC-2 type transport system permease protein